MWGKPWRINSKRQGIKKLLGQMTAVVTEQCQAGKEHSQVSLSARPLSMEADNGLPRAKSGGRETG